MIDFTPSQVYLAAIPLCATMGRAESEFAAALIVRTCQLLGDEWRSVSPRQIGEMLRDDLEAKREPMASLSHNPFFRPDVWELVSRGFAQWIGEPGKSPVELTDCGLERLRPWVRSQTAPDAPI